MDNPTRRLDSDNPDLAASDVADRCPKCGGDRVWADVTVTLPKGTNVGVQFSRKVGDHLFLGPQINTTLCKSLVCSTCGFAEFYANKPRYLVEET